MRVSDPGLSVFGFTVGKEGRPRRRFKYDQVQVIWAQQSERCTTKKRTHRGKDESRAGRIVAERYWDRKEVMTAAKRNPK